MNNMFVGLGHTCVGSPATKKQKISISECLPLSNHCSRLMATDYCGCTGQKKQLALAAQLGGRARPGQARWKMARHSRVGSEKRTIGSSGLSCPDLIRRGNELGSARSARGKHEPSWAEQGQAKRAEPNPITKAIRTKCIFIMNLKARPLCDVHSSYQPGNANASLIHLTQVFE